MERFKVPVVTLDSSLSGSQSKAFNYFVIKSLNSEDWLMIFLIYTVKDACMSDQYYAEIVYCTSLVLSLLVFMLLSWSQEVFYLYPEK